MPEPDRPRILARVGPPGEELLVFEQAGYRRCAFVANPSMTQGAQSLTDSLDFRFEYLPLLIATLAFPPRPRRLLVLGLGVGAVPRLAQRLLPDLRVDVVEISAAALEVATGYFGLRPSEQLRIHLEDAATWVPRAVGRGAGGYDVVHLDCFDARGVPDALVRADLLTALGALLAPGGVVAANLMQGHANYASTMRRWADCFGGRWLMPARAHTNRVPVGAVGGALDLVGARRRARALDASGRLPFSLESALARGRLG